MKIIASLRKNSLWTSPRTRALFTAVREAALSMGYQEKQIEAACQVLSGKDTFVALPTGYGKSIVIAFYQELLVHAGNL